MNTYRIVEYKVILFAPHEEFTTLHVLLPQSIPYYFCEDVILYFFFPKRSVTFATFDFTLFSAQLSGWRASQVVFHESVPLTHIAPLSAWNPLFLFIGKNNGTVIIIKSSSISSHATCFIESEKGEKVWFSSWKQKNLTRLF